MFFCSAVMMAQFNKIYTGTNTNLINLSVLNKNILINGEKNYLVKSTDECESLFALFNPGPIDYNKYMNRLDLNTIFLLSNKTGGRSVLYKSIDGGNNWISLLDTTGVFHSSVAFFDQNEGIVARHTHLIKTKDGGVSWHYGSISISGNTVLPYISPLKTYSTNMICFGISSGAFYLSKDRGETLKYSHYVNNSPTDFFFFNKDTIFALSISGDMAKTVNGGNTWKNYQLPIDSARGIYFKDQTGYVFGTDKFGWGTIIKTTDMGLTWSTLKTGYKTNLTNMAALNDSIALLSGSDGILLRWNYKVSLFTGLTMAYMNWMSVNAYPNPVKDFLYFDYSPDNIEIDKIIIINMIGQVVEEKISPGSSINLETLPAGLYYLKIDRAGIVKPLKLIKL